MSTPSTIGQYGAWAASLVPDGPPKYSLRRSRFADLEEWRALARERFFDRIAQPDTGSIPAVTVHSQSTFDGLHIEELSWQLPYGPRTKALFLKPANASGRLPGVVALHDHGGNKYLGKRKIAQSTATQHPMVIAHQTRSYGGRPWANYLAKRGFAVLVPDAFAFASRRVRLEEVIEPIRNGLSDQEPEDSDNIVAYNQWAAAHEAILAKSLFSAGTTWPGVFLAEDQRALDVLCARDDVDPDRIGCGGLSGGGLRTVFLGGADPRIRCAVCVGMMTTWRDYLLNKCQTHTWMCYVPLLPRELDYPEILALRAPFPTLVQNNNEDPLFTLPEMQRADRIMQSVYDKAVKLDPARRNRTEPYRCTFYPGPHKFDLEMQAEAFDWFENWLS